MKITVSADNDKNHGKRPNLSLHKRPWFWLLIILIVSVAVRLSSRFQYTIPFETEDDDPKDVGIVSRSNEEITRSDETFTQSEGESAEEESSNTDPGKSESEKGIFHFILNINTKKYHTKECSAAKKLCEEKRLDTDIEADSPEEAKKIIESKGYELCGICDR